MSREHRFDRVRGRRNVLPGRSSGSSSTPSCIDTRYWFPVIEYVGVLPGNSSEGNVPFRPAQLTPDRQDASVLKVERVDFKVVQNARPHHTNEFDICETSTPKLVVRRGQEFTIEIEFSREYKEKKDDLRLMFEIGKLPLVSKGTQAEFVLSHEDKPGEWGAKITKQHGKTIWVTIFTPPNCIVGKWNFKVNVVQKSDENASIYRYSHKDPIYILFNPWCKDDTVYMENQRDLEEYILNETGFLYSEGAKSITGIPWVFGQFTGNVLDCSMYLLEISDLNIAVRGNPIPVVRKLTAMINSNDEDGVLTGNWSNNFSQGKSPTSWTGSVEILEQFYQQKLSVRFGQCWVFSGVMTTVCRALGIPARSVTNFSSAHDADTSTTLDVYYLEDGRPDETKRRESIWNFHVWNEVWLTRPDLPAGYGGWQVCDATPQEASDGIHCCGPTSVKAIKEGEINIPYDGPFVFAEINADLVHWTCRRDGRTEIRNVDKNCVGKKISTKAVLKNEKVDITHLYKCPEGSPEERVVVLKASQCSSRPNIYVKGASDVKFQLEFDSQNTFVGQDFVLALRATNNSQQTRTVKGRLTVSTVYYTGIIADEVGVEVLDNFTLQPGKAKEVKLRITPDVYLRKLKDFYNMSIIVLAKVEETQQYYAKRETTRLRKPHLTIQVPNAAKVGEEFEVQVSFTNPLNTTQTDCYLEVDGPGVTKATRYPQSDVQAKGTFVTKFKLKPVKKGKRQIIVLFNSRQLEGINGTHDIEVRE